MNIVISVFENPFQCIRVFPCSLSKLRFCKMMSSEVLACKQTLCYFSFRSFQKLMLAKMSAEREKEK